MKKIIDHIVEQKLGTFKESVVEILNAKKAVALDKEKMLMSESFFLNLNESDDSDEDDEGDYEEEDPNFDVSIDPSEFDENDMTELESIIWDDEDLEEEVNVDEELERVEELSKKTLGSYVKKASDDKAIDAYESGKKAESEKTDPRKFGKFPTKLYNRTKGINRAVNKLTKEQLDYAIEHYEELDELSKKTLGSYINKAKDDYANKGYELATSKANHEHNYDNVNRAQHNAPSEVKDALRKTQNTMQDKQNEKERSLRKKIFKRDKGIGRAVNKLTKD